MDQIAYNWSSIAKAYQCNYPKLLNTSRRLAKDGWLTSPTMTPKEFAELESVPDIGEFFINYYSNNDNYARLKSDVLSYELYDKHCSLINECFYNYENKRYKIIIPASISIIEGYIAGLCESNKYGNALIKELDSLIKQSEEDNIRFLVLNSIHVFLVEMFAHKQFDDKRPAFLNRNWIMHGRDNSDLWNQADAIRLLNALHSFTLI